MLELEEIRRLLKDMNLSKVAEVTGVPYGRIWRLVHTAGSPSYETVRAMAQYLESRTLTKAA